MLSRGPTRAGDDLPEDLAAMKERFDQMGYSVQFPRSGATWHEPEPLDLKGDSAGDVVVRLRGNDV